MKLIKCFLFLAFILSIYGIYADNGAFASVTKAITIFSPNGGEKMVPGEKIMIRWDNQLRNHEVKLYLWDGIKKVETYIASSNKNEYIWQVPDDLKGDMFRVKVADAHSPSIYDMSDNFFVISEMASEPVVNNNYGYTQGKQQQENASATPNPSSDFVNISINTNDKILQVTVLDLLGNEFNVRTDYITDQSVRINTTVLNAGTYQVVLKTTGTYISKKFIKM